MFSASIRTEQITVTTQPQPGQGPVKTVIATESEMVSPNNFLYFNRNDSIIQEVADTSSRKGFTAVSQSGDRIYRVTEDSDSSCFGKEKIGRGFTMHIYDEDGTETMRVIRIKKHFTSYPCCCDCCADEVVVEAPVGNVIGYIINRWGESYRVLDAERKLLLRINYLPLMLSCCKCENSCKCDDCCKCDKWEKCYKCENMGSFCQGPPIKLPIFDLHNTMVGFYWNRWSVNFKDFDEKMKHLVGLEDLPQIQQKLVLAGGLYMNVQHFEPAESTCYGLFKYK